MSQDLKAKLTSRKWWAHVAGLAGGALIVAYGILAENNDAIAQGAGVISVSIGGYFGAEGIADFAKWLAGAIKDRTTTTKTVAATATDKATVQAVMGTETAKEA